MFALLRKIIATTLSILLINSVLIAQNPCDITCIPNGVELVVNGNFELGNTGFFSSYSYLQGPAPVLNEGFYTVIDNPNNIHSGFQACADHTSGSGQQMVLNGATQSNVSLWCQTITIQPNTDYNFSTWVQSMNNQNPAQLQFSINGINLGNVFSPPALGCQWVQFFTVWNSGANTTATICIVNQNTNAGGNDFALDDISFIECTPVEPYNVSVIYDNARCFGDTNGLATANVGQAWGGVPPYTINWSTGQTGNSITNLAAGNYQMIVTDDRGCNDTAAFTITSAPFYEVDLGNDTVSCFGVPFTLANLATEPAGIDYVWSTGAITPTITTDTSGIFILAGVVDECIIRDTIEILISPDFIVDIGPIDTIICNGGSGITLTTLDSLATSYLWSTIDNPALDTTYQIQVTEAGLYKVEVTYDNQCVKSDSINVGETLCTSIVYMPDAFTPDGDGVNDAFFPLISGIITDVSVYIFNRWGIEVFSSTDINFKWDGMINNRPASDGVYFWILSYTDDKGLPQTKTGTVTRIGG